MPESGAEKENALKRNAKLSEDALIILPLRNTVVFPLGIVPLALGRPASVQAVQEAVRQERPIGLLGDPGVG